MLIITKNNIYNPQATPPSSTRKINQNKSKKSRSSSSPPPSAIDGFQWSLRTLPPPDHIKSSVPDSGDGSTHIIFLVSNSEAGSVIGKGGTTITDFQSESGTRIQLSRTNELFPPGTGDRIIMVAGNVEQVLNAMYLILNKLLTEMEKGVHESEPRSRVRMIVPNLSCGGLIGKGGFSIKSSIEASRAGIKISPLDANYHRLSDRMLMITGSLGEQMEAIKVVLHKLFEDPHYPHYVNVPFSYAGTYGTNFGSNTTRGQYPNNRDDQDNSSTTIGISDDHIGLVLGRGGRNISEISQVSGARIKLSDRGDFISAPMKGKSRSHDLKEQYTQPKV